MAAAAPSAVGRGAPPRGRAPPRPGRRGPLAAGVIEPDGELVWVQHGRIVAQLQECFPEAARLLVEAAQTCWPSPASLKEYWRQIWSNNPQERLNREFRRRTDIVGIFPTGPPCCDWSAQFLAKQHDESPSPGAT